jgi:hypothetical protein
MDDQFVARPLPIHRTHKHRINAYTHHTSMPCVGFEPTIPASERAKTVHVLDRSATVTGLLYITFLLMCLFIAYPSISSPFAGLFIRPYIYPYIRQYFYPPSHPCPFYPSFYVSNYIYQSLRTSICLSILPPIHFIIHLPYIYLCSLLSITFVSPSAIHSCDYYNISGLITERIISRFENHAIHNKHL